MARPHFFKGQNISAYVDDNHTAHIVLKHGTSSVNKFDKDSLAELRGCVDSLQQQSEVSGLLVRSDLDTFVVGADVTEFRGYFKGGNSAIQAWLRQTQELFCNIEDLPYPSICLIDGICLGGGFELALSCGFRIGTARARLGLPEVKLGIYPGWGGTVRLPRLIGFDNAAEWIAGGRTYKAEEALKVGVLDALVSSEDLEAAGQSMLVELRAEERLIKARYREKAEKLQFVSPLEKVMAFESARAVISAKVGKNYPAPLTALSVMNEHADKGRDEAIAIEIAGFANLAPAPETGNLLGIFLNEQYVKRKNKSYTRDRRPTESVGVLGAGIMGGGIAYQSATNGVPVFLKDLERKAIDLGLGEAAKLLQQGFERKKISTKQMLQTMGAINGTLSYDDFGKVDLVIEAIVENEQIKKAVYAEVEKHVREDALICSNTSSIQITKLARDLKRPENFCGLHFFNPVARMPLVEVIRGPKTSDDTVAKAVAFATQIKKTPVVVNDCPGFLVNRILFPYFSGFEKMVMEGYDFQHIDQVMERFGWPMGPAYLIDVIGLDTGVHASKIMAEAFPERLAVAPDSIMSNLLERNRLGQKNGQGFYKYGKDRRGKLVKEADPEVNFGQKRADEAEIVERLMLPMINESLRCLEEGVVASPMEVDLALVFGLGFPPFRGGLLMYADQLGSEALHQANERWQEVGGLYSSPDLLVRHSQEKSGFYQTN